MNHEVILFFLGICIFLLVCVVIYQQAAFRTGMRRRLKEFSVKLKDILDHDSDESVMVFTENRELMGVAEQVNRLLEEHRKVKADFRRSEISSRKMLSNISHDIKTPLTVVLGYLEMIRLNGEEKDEMLEKVEQKAQSVLELINEFFTLAKLEAGDMDMELSRLDINEICRESILDFYGLLTKNAFQVEVNIPETQIYVQGNRKALQRILSNLISNAIRYGSKGQYLGITLWEKENFVYLDITDKGKGIEQEYAACVFDRLFTMEDSRSRQVQGNGLGLTIAKNLAVQMGGDVSFESIPDVRTVFTVKLRKLSY